MRFLDEVIPEDPPRQTFLYATYDYIVSTLPPVTEPETRELVHDVKM